MKKWLGILVLFLLPALSFAQDWRACLPAEPEEKGLVFDKTERGFLTQTERNRLNTKLKNFAVETSNQILVLSVDDLCGIEPWQYATEIGQKWGVGGLEKFDNGVVVLVKPYGKEGQRHVFIAPGYGLEGIIPDAVCKRIVENEILPQFRKGKMYEGLDKATNVLMGLAKQEFNQEDYAKGNEGSPAPFFAGVILIFLFIVGISLLAQRSKVKRYAALNSIGFWEAWHLLAEADRKHRGEWSDFNRRGGGPWIGGGGGGSIGGGGGFGGFGGGGFGGGGAGGSW